ncbi:hypothetical protein BCR44DRAFT_1137778 [Catenaria anguillulae PL171]|uniref:Uncharacterized protein n=1 Tax=Catenaria anguillulae PL171 TaxID=765915 RepID=A0A1Y2HJY6_9FUNG|nr:hypothetical protein BCR44DRAFT_1137778 [Catenaria anguillulae PL171]
MDTADDGECTSRTRGARTLIPYPHVRSVSDSHHHVLLGPRGLKRAKSIGKGAVAPGSGDAPKISSYFRTLKRTGAAHGPGLFSKSLSDPTLAPASSAVVGRSFKRAGTPAMGGSKAHGGAAAMSSYFTKPGSFKAKPVALPFTSTRTGQQKPSSPSRGTLGSSYAAKSILADAFERMSISPSTRPVHAPQVGAGMGFVDGAMATVQFEAQQASSGGFAASSAVTEYGYAIGFPGRRG